MKKKVLTYSEALNQLKVISQDIQQGKVPIEKMASVIHQAKELIAFCRQALRGIELELKNSNSVFDPQDSDDQNN